jgi:hypothetical protein
MVAERDAEVRGTGPVGLVSWPDEEERQLPSIEFSARTWSV